MSEDRSDERLDRAIDAALRDMIAGDGPADMRRRVLARLAEPRRRAPSRTVALAAAAAILIALAAVVWRHGRSVPAPALATARRPPAALPTPPPVPLLPSSPAPAVRPRPPLPPVVPAAEEAEAAGGEIEPIEVAPLAVPPLETPRWAIAPLRIQPMEVAPLADSEPEEP
jgi:hypothetical protein